MLVGYIPLNDLPSLDFFWLGIVRNPAFFFRHLQEQMVRVSQHLAACGCFTADAIFGRFSGKDLAY